MTTKKSAVTKKANFKPGYADGFLLVVPVKNIPAYKRMASAAGKIWMEHGALEYKECSGDDLNIKMGIPYHELLKSKPGETIIFSWITFKSRAHRDKVNAKVMKDPRLACSMDMNNMPFDFNRMSFGGFKVIVSH